MQAGKLRHRIDLEQMTLTHNDYNEPIETWQPIGCYQRMPAAIIPLSGRESQFAGRTQATMSHRIETRYMKNVAEDARLRVKYGSRIFNVEGIMNVGGRDREHHFMCVEVKDG